MMWNKHKEEMAKEEMKKQAAPKRSCSRPPPQCEIFDISEGETLLPDNAEDAPEDADHFDEEEQSSPGWSRAYNEHISGQEGKDYLRTHLKTSNLYMHMEHRTCTLTTYLKLVNFALHHSCSREDVNRMDDTERGSKMDQKCRRPRHEGLAQSIARPPVPNQVNSEIHFWF